MDCLRFDVAIVGGGPAGSAAALGLLAHAPSLTVALVEATGYETVRIGETLPPQARDVLEHLDVWKSFAAQGHREVYGTSAAWGAPLPLDNDFIYMPARTGWHLDRAAFDALLAREVQQRGAALMLNTRLLRSDLVGGAWHLKLSSGRVLAAQFVVDATGSAVFARRRGAGFVGRDRMVGLARFFDGDDPGDRASDGCASRERGGDSGYDPRTLVEAFEDGWWYTAGLPGGRCVVACMTDADVARRLNLTRAGEWNRRLAELQNIGARLRGRKACSPVLVRPSESRRLEPAAGDNWLAVGDSASRFDPLSSQGIVKALRSGVFASYAIGDLLTRCDDSGLRRYRHYVREEFNRYAEIRTKYYRQEQRWPHSDFWRRKQALPQVEEGEEGRRNHAIELN